MRSNYIRSVFRCGHLEDGCHLYSLSSCIDILVAFGWQKLMGFATLVTIGALTEINTSDYLQWYIVSV